MWLSVVAVSVGAVIGANLRWALSLWLNASYHAIPWGTLVANLSGGWLIGLLMGFFTHSSSLAPEWRLFAVTGLCGALTTFSAFSLEMFAARLRLSSSSAVRCMLAALADASARRRCSSSAARLEC